MTVKIDGQLKQGVTGHGKRGKKDEEKFKERGGDPRILNKTHKNNHKLSYDISLKKRYYKILGDKYIDVGF